MILKLQKWNGLDQQILKMIIVLVPANAVYHPYISENTVKIFQSNTNGLASGNRIEEAVFHGMMEVVERDAWSIFESKRQQKPEINCENTENADN